MTKDTSFAFGALKVIAYIIFIGYCIQAGTLIFNFAHALIFKTAAKNLYMGLDLMDLFKSNIRQFIYLMSLIIATSVLKAYLFYLVIKLLEKVNLGKPFSEVVSDSISKCCTATLEVAILTLITQWVANEMVNNPNSLHQARDLFSDGQAYLVMTAVLYVISHVFKKGLELQNEQDLTV